jgi:transposase InsO family protein
MDDGPEFVSTRLLQCTSDQGVHTALSQPGKPWQNGTDKRFKGKFRDECLSMEYFRNRPEARVVSEQGRRHCSEARPHSAPGYLTSGRSSFGTRQATTTKPFFFPVFPGAAMELSPSAYVDTSNAAIKPS